MEFNLPYKHPVKYWFQNTGARAQRWADELNRHFSSVGSNIATSLGAAAAMGPELTPRPPKVSSGAFQLVPATLPELSAALRQMSSSRASGEDGITVAMLRMTFSVVGPHLLS